MKYSLERWNQNQLEYFNTKTMIRVRRCFFLNFSQDRHRRSDCNCISTRITLKGGGKLILGGFMQNPYLARLKAVLRQREGSSLTSLLEREKNSLVWYQVTEWVGDYPVFFRCQGFLDRGGSVRLVCWPKTVTGPGMTIWAFFRLEYHHKLILSLLDVSCIDSFTTSLSRWQPREQTQCWWSISWF
jgi:hypothetical protein